MSDFPMTRFDSVRPSAGRVSERHPVGWLRMAFRIYLTRRALMNLTAREFADIGVSPAAAVAESARLPWDTNPGPRRRKPGTLTAIQGALERARSRRLISRMSARELRDIGISATDARSEATKCFWQL
jgi:uncharacterized protein YjiS (DUF1127 family)